VIELENNVLQALLIMAYLCIALISMVIAVYAIGASYQGRETQLSKWRKKRRRDELERRIKELGQKADLQGVREEIKRYDDEIDEIDSKLFDLSVWGTIILPISLFFTALVLVAVIVYFDPTGMLSLPTGGGKYAYPTSEVLTGIAISSMAAGVFFQIKTLFAIEWSASRVPLPEFWTRFPNDVEKMRFKPQEQVTVAFVVGNRGDEVGENLKVLIHFPPSFVVQAGAYDVIKQESGSIYPNFSSAIFGIRSLHVATVVQLSVSLTMPENEGSYEIPITIYEKKIRSHASAVSIEIAK
jgi:hypothetical protein